MTASIQRVPVSMPPNSTALNRLATMLGHYDFRVFVSENAYFDVGAGSLAIIERVEELGGEGLIGTIGRFCEVSASAKIHAWGAHDHDQPINITFGGCPFLKHAVGFEESFKPRKPFHIGNGVVISANAIVLSGTRVGDGVVIGAGAVVSGELEPFGIYAGNPGRKIREREPGAAWWDFDIAYMVEAGAGLREVAGRRDASHRYRQASPRFVLRTYTQSLDLVGYLLRGELVPIASAPPSVLDYVRQAVESPQPYWQADCWAD